MNFEKNLSFCFVLTGPSPSYMIKVPKIKPLPSESLFELSADSNRLERFSVELCSTSGTVYFFILLTFEITGLVSDSPSEFRSSSTLFDFVLDKVTSKLSSELEASCFCIGSKSLSGSDSEIARFLVLAGFTETSSSESSMLMIGGFSTLN